MVREDAADMEYLFLVILLILPFSALGELKVHIIDVGQGDAILVQCDRQNLL